MSSEKIEVETAATDAEPMLGIVDIILLAVLIVGGAWWFLRSKKKKEDTSSTKSYSIQ